VAKLKWNTLCIYIYIYMYCDVFFNFKEFSSDDREKFGERKRRQKKRAEKVLAFGGAGMEGAPARAAAKRRPSRDLEVGRQIRSFTYQFAKREIRDKHGPSSPRAD